MLHHLLFPQYKDRKWKHLNLDEESQQNTNLFTNPLLDPKTCETWVKGLHARDGIDFSYGGWMEDRMWLWRGHYQKPGHTIHVGVDYNVPPDTPVYLPGPGRLILMEEDPDRTGGWGTRMIFQMGTFETGTLFVTFAHLWNAYGFVGRSYEKGHMLGEVGSYPHNGNWFPHLHVQVQRKYDPTADGYQRYTEQLESEFPNPEQVLCLNEPCVRPAPSTESPRCTTAAANG